MARFTWKNSYSENVAAADAYFRIEKNFDIIGRELSLGARRARLYFVNGFVKDALLEKVLEFLLRLPPETLEACRSPDALAACLPHVDVSVQTDAEAFAAAVFSGVFGLLVEGFDAGLLFDARAYPARSIAEPDNDKVLRGSHEGFTETLLCNTALIRRRIRDRALTMEQHRVGDRSKTDIVLCYLDHKVDRKLLRRLRTKLAQIDVHSLCMGQESLAECLVQRQRYNPFPKVRYTERPDSAAASIYEGSIVVLTDNSPAAMILPTSFFLFLQDTNDYYFPPIVGTYLRFVRAAIFALAMLLSPVWYLFFANPEIAPGWFSVFAVRHPYSIPVIAQILLIEVVIDALKLASLNTPNALSNSLSLIGALVLGELAVEARLFAAEVVLIMAFVSVANFAQPSFELGYAFKLSRIFILIVTAIFGVWGFALSLAAVILTIALTDTASGKSYLYPLIPFRREVLVRLLIRKPISKENT